MTAVQQIALIDRRIEGVRSELGRRVGRMNIFCGHSWQLAWDRNPDLHARNAELNRQRGEIQQIRDAEIERQWRAEQRRERAAAKKRYAAKHCPTCGHYTLMAA